MLDLFFCPMNLLRRQLDICLWVACFLFLAYLIARLKFTIDRVRLKPINFSPVCLWDFTSNLAVISWVTFCFYESGMREWEQTVIVPIRVDIVLITPLLYLLTMLSIFSSWRLFRRCQDVRTLPKHIRTAPKLDTNWLKLANGLNVYNIALGVACLLSGWFAPSDQLAALPGIRSFILALPPYGRMLFIVIANYVIPSILLFFLITRTRIRQYVLPTRLVHILFVIGNLATVIYRAATVLCVSASDGGETYAWIVIWAYPVLMLRIGLYIGAIILFTNVVKYRRGENHSESSNRLTSTDTVNQRG